MKMKRSEVVMLDSILEGLKRVKETRFAYAVAKNRQFLKSEIESIQAAREPSEKMKEYEQKRAELVMQYAAKDKQGNPIEAGQGAVQIQKEKVQELSGKIKELEKDNSEAVEDFKTKDKALTDLLKEEIEVQVYRIKAEVLPSDLNSVEIEKLLPLVDGDIEAVFAEKSKK